MQIEREHYPLLLAICAALFSTPLMVAGVNAVLPELGRSLDASAAQLSLVSAVYSLGLAIFQLACGSLGDIWGHKRVFLWGASLFVFTSAILSMLNSIYLFLMVRLLQGIGGAMLSAAGLALLTSVAPPQKRASYLGVSGAAVYSGIAFGPPLAGLIAGAFNWRWLFGINCVTAIIVYMLMKYASKHEWRPASHQKFDWTGCILYALSMCGLTIGASQLSQRPLIGWLALGSFAVFLIIFCFKEGHTKFPILNLRLLERNRVLSLSSLAAFVNYASFFGIIFYFSFYIQVAKGFNVEITGMILAFQPIVQALTTPLATRLCNSWGAAPVSAIGSASCGIGLLAGAMLTPQTHIAVLFLAQGLLGSGMGLFALANTSMIMDSAGQRHIGQASALTGTMRSAGQLCSMVLITLTLGFYLGSAQVSQDTLDGFMQSMRVNMFVFGALNVCAIAIVIGRNRHT